MKLLLVAGPPGAGSTTAAVEISGSATDSGARVAVVTADRFASWPDAAAVHLADPARMLDAAWPRYAGGLGSVGVDLDPAELAVLPGADAAALLLKVASALSTGDHDLLIVDAGALATALLSVPETAGFLLDAVLPTPVRLIRRAGGTRHGMLGLAEQLADRMLLARAALTGSGCTVHLVRPEQPQRAAAADRLRTELALLRFPADEPVLRDGDGFGWSIPLPGAQRAEMELRRIDTDLVLTVFAATRRIELPPVLQRCELIGAQLAAAGTDDARLLCEFRPDPARWPRSVPTARSEGHSDE